MIQEFSKQVQELSINYYDFGNSDAQHLIVILHGWNQLGNTNWIPVAKELYQRLTLRHISARIILPSMPGFGKSQEPTSLWEAIDYSRFIQTFIQIVIPNLPRSITIIGHSFGGAVATLLASQEFFHQTPGQLILVAPAIIRTQPTKKQQLIGRISHFGKQLFQLPIIQPTYQLSRSIWYKLIGSPDYHKTSPQMAQIMQRVIRKDLSDQYAQVTWPVHLIWGTKDTYTPLWQAHKLQSIYPKKLSILDDINHGIHLHAQDRLVDLCVQDILNLSSDPTNHKT